VSLGGSHSGCDVPPRREKPAPSGSSGRDLSRIDRRGRDLPLGGPCLELLLRPTVARTGIGGEAAAFMIGDGRKGGSVMSVEAIEAPGADFVIDQGYERYGEEEHAIWRSFVPPHIEP